MGGPAPGTNLAILNREDASHHQRALPEGDDHTTMGAAWGPPSHVEGIRGARHLQEPGVFSREVAKQARRSAHGE